MPVVSARHVSAGKSSPIRPGLSALRGAGRWSVLGWWTCATKLNLALAAGLALPLLSAAGYRSGTSESAGLQALAWAYGGLPCLLKLAAAALLWRAERLHSSWRHT